MMYQFRAGATLASLSVALYLSFTALHLSAGEFQVPRINVVDKLGVNLASGQISHTLETLSIGGALGLSHTISGFTNNFSYIGYRGYQDKYIGTVRYSLIGENVSDGTQNFANMYVMNVSDFTGTVPFKIMINGVHQYLPNPVPTSGYTYEALGDTRNTLEVDPTDAGYLLWTKPDGTVVRYVRDGYRTANSGGALEKITYPNGYTITVTGVPSSVRSNTGFQLKYHFAAFNYALDKPDAYIPGSPPTGAWERNPAGIKAINAAVEYCNDVIETECVLTKDWPKASFIWPSGMPRTMFINYPISASHPTSESAIFTVIDAKGGRTEYHFEAQDIAHDDLGYAITPTPVPAVAPRLVGIKTAGSAAVNVKYSYSNMTYTVDYNGNFLFPPELKLASELGKIHGAAKDDMSVGYNMFQNPWNSPDMRNSGGGSSDIEEVVTRGKWGGNLSLVQTKLGKHNFEFNWRNFPTSYLPYYGPREDYEYDARGNLSKITRGTAVQQAGYPSTCNNRKTCNKPTWTRDARGNQTDYTYHLASGQVETETLPANKNGVRAQTRYEYTPLSATYYGPSGSRITGTPIYLKTAEKYCTNSNFSGSGNGASQFTGSCGAGDQEVVTRYEYNSDNRLLTGMTVTADSKTLRTCYQYDIYGNLIGKTDPKANLASCN